MKTLIVTGSASGIGFEIAKYFLEREYRVVFSDLNKEALDKTLATFTDSKYSSNCFGVVCDVANEEDTYCYMPMNGFTTSDIGCEKGNSSLCAITKFETPHSLSFLQMFDAYWQDKDKLQDVTEQIIDSITSVYKENSPEFIYFITLYNIFNEFLEDISEDVLPNEATGFKQSKIWNLLYNFQKDAVLAIINKLEK